MRDEADKMTTIATDGITIAADSKRCAGGEVVDLCTTKIRIKGRAVFALTGDFAVYDAAIDWYLQGADPTKVPSAGKNVNWSLLAIDENGLRRYTPETPYPDPFGYPQAFGSGCSYALAALKLGKSPKEAIELASSLDIYTGGPIQVINIADAMAMPLKEAAE